MCGIIAVMLSGTIPYSHRKDLEDFVKQAVHVGMVRGRDSTGIMYKPVDGDVCHFKKAVDGAIFRDLRATNKILSNVCSNQFTIIHNRSATIGGYSDSHAHPYEVGDITLLHNGTLYNYRSLPGEEGALTDSHAVAQALNSVGPERSDDILEAVDGAYVFFWYDKRDGSLNMAKNAQRPLSIAYLKEIDALVCASEAGMLEWLLTRNDLKHSDIWQPKPFQHFKWYVGKDKPWEYDLSTYEKKSRTTTNGASGRTVTASKDLGDNQLKALTEVEKTLGLKRFDDIEFTSFDYIPYGKNSPYGTLKGYPKCYSFEVVAYNVHEDTVYGMDEFAGKFAYVSSKTSTPDWKVLVLTDVVRVVDEDIDEEDGEEFALATLPFLDANDSSRLVRGPGGTFIPEAEWTARVEDGCAMCSTPLLFPQETYWTHNEECLCQDCNELREEEIKKWINQ